MTDSAQRAIFLFVLTIASCSAGAAAAAAAAPPATRPAATTTTTTRAAAAAGTQPTMVSAKMSGNPLTVGDSAVFIFRRSGPVDKDLPVSFLPHGDTQEGVDFEPMPRHITMPAGFAVASLYVPTLSNPQRSGERTIGLRVMPPPEENPEAWLKPTTAPATPAATRSTTQPATGR